MQHSWVYNVFHDAVNVCDGVASDVGELIARIEQWWQIWAGNSKYTDKYWETSSSSTRYKITH